MDVSGETTTGGADGSALPGGARVALAGVTKRFDDVTAVDALDLDVAEGEFLVLLGPSGCGKSTALRMIAGLEDPTEGTITIGDRDVTDVEAKDRDVAMVFQSYALYPHMTVRRNIEFPLKSRHVPRADRQRLVDEVSEVLGLGELMDRKPAQLSGGQRQRVALARAIVRRPAVFLMDEPLSNLDAKLRVQTRGELIELHRRSATTVVYVTHDQVEAMTMGHRIAVMDGGVLQQVAPPADVYDRPANLFVAGFIGNPPMNLLEGDPVPAGPDGGPAVAVGEAHIPLTADQGTAVAASGATRVVVGVRPEHLVTGAGPLTAEVVVVESLGHERHLVCRTPDGQQVIARVPGEGPAPEQGDRLTLGLDPARTHLFDAASGARVGP